MRALIRQCRDDFLLAAGAVEQQRDLVSGPRHVKDFAAGAVDFRGGVDSVHVSEAPQEKEPAQRIRIDGEARPAFRDLLERPLGPGREAHLGRHLFLDRSR